MSLNNFNKLFLANKIKNELNRYEKHQREQKPSNKQAIDQLVVLMARIATDPSSLQLPAFPKYTKQSAASVTVQGLKKKQKPLNPDCWEMTL